MNDCKRVKKIYDYGNEPFVTNIIENTKNNTFFRRALWTGDYLQLTLMCINPKEEIGIEQHQNTDQILFLVHGYACFKFGECKNALIEKITASPGDAIFIPAGSWHNVINIGNSTLKLYSIYGPPNHPYGTTHKIKDVEEHFAY